MSAMRSEFPVIQAPEQESVQSRFGRKHDEKVAAELKKIATKDAQELSDMREALLHNVEEAAAQLAKEEKVGSVAAKTEKRLDLNKQKLDALDARLKELGVEVESHESVPPESGERLTLVPDESLKKVEAAPLDEIDADWPEEPPTNPMRVKTPAPRIESGLNISDANASDDRLAARIAERESSASTGRRAARTAAGFRAQAAARKSVAATAPAEPPQAKAPKKPRNVAADQFPKDVPAEDFNLLPEYLRRRYELKPGESADDLPALQAKHQEERYRALSELRAPKQEKTKAKVPRPTPEGEAVVVPVKPEADESAKKAETVTEKNRDVSLDRFPDDISAEDIEQLPEHLRRRYELKLGESIEDLPALQAKHQEERLRALSELRAPKREIDPEDIPLALSRKKEKPGETVDELKKNIKTWYARLLAIAEDPKHADERKELDQKITKAEALLDQKLGESKAAEVKAEAAQIKREIAEIQERWEAAMDEVYAERERDIQERKKLAELQRAREKAFQKAQDETDPDSVPAFMEMVHDLDRQIFDTTNAVQQQEAEVTDAERSAAGYDDQKDAALAQYNNALQRGEKLGLALAALALTLEKLKDVSLDAETSAQKKALNAEEAALLKEMQKPAPSDFGAGLRSIGRGGGKGLKYLGLATLGLVGTVFLRPFKYVGGFLGQLYQATMNPEKYFGKVKERYIKSIEKDGPVLGVLKGTGWMFFGEEKKKEKEKGNASESSSGH